MKNKQNFLLAVRQTLLVIMLVVCSYSSALCATSYVAGGVNATNALPKNGNAQFVLQPDSIFKLEHRALLGSGEAAIRLGSYYYFVKLDETSGRYWMTIAAENGLPNGMYDLGFYLTLSHDEMDQIRARYWLERAKEAGSNLTARLAESLLSKMAKRGKEPEVTHGPNPSSTQGQGSGSPRPPPPGG